MTQKLDTIIDSLSNLTVLEMSELAKLLEDKWGVKAMAMAAAAPVAVAAADAGAGAAEEKTEFDLKLVGFDADKKLAVIKEARNVNSELSLGAAKDLVEKSASEAQLLFNGNKETVEKHKKSIEAAGGKVTIS